MNLSIRYSQEDDIVRLSTSESGEGGETTTLVEENGDPADYWCPDDEPDALNLIAVSLRNALAHLSSVIASISRDGAKIRG